MQRWAEISLGRLMVQVAGMVPSPVVWSGSELRPFALLDVESDILLALPVVTALDRWKNKMI